MNKRIIKIGVTYTGSDEKHNNYVRWLKADDHLEIITLSHLNTSLDCISDFDGIVLSGGIDMHPKNYFCETIDYPHAPDEFHEHRDEFEIRVFEICQQYNIPVIGVCRGMQLVNCFLGGTMNQDLGFIANNIHKCEPHDKAHGIKILPETLLKEIVGVHASVANSAHHQSIETLGYGLAINCFSDDGVIEGLEWGNKENKAFFLGVQWHPERMSKIDLGDSPLSKNIREYFLAEIKKAIRA